MTMDVDACLANIGKVSESSRPLLAAIILFFTLVGVISNLLLLSVLIFHWKVCFRSQHFTFFVMNMIVAGLLYSMTNLWVSIPCTVNECPFIWSDEIMITLATPNSLAHWGYLFSSLAFAIYRFGIFMSKTFAEKKIYTKVLLISPWVLTFLLTFSSTALGCYKRYSRLALQYTYNCSQCDIILGISFIDFNFFGGQAIPLVMIVAYAIILISVYRNRRNNNGFHSRQSLVDARLAFQFIIICLSQYLAAFLFFMVPKASRGADWGVLATNSIGTINVSVNPIVLLLCNHQVRNGILIIVRRRGNRKITEVTITQMSPKQNLTKSIKIGTSHCLTLQS